MKMRNMRIKPCQTKQLLFPDTVDPTATYPHHPLAGSQMPTHSALHTKALFPWQLLGRMLAVGRDLSRFVQQQLGFIQQKYAKNRNWSTVGTEKGSPNLVSTIHSFWSRTFQSSSLSCIYWGLPGKWIWWYRPWYLLVHKPKKYRLIMIEYDRCIVIDPL